MKSLRKEIQTELLKYGSLKENHKEKWCYSNNWFRYLKLHQLNLRAIL